MTGNSRPALEDAPRRSASIAKKLAPGTANRSNYNGNQVVPNLMTGGTMGSYQCQSNFRLVMRYPPAKQEEAERLRDVALTHARAWVRPDAMWRRQRVLAEVQALADSIDTDPGANDEFKKMLRNAGEKRLRQLQKK